MGDRMDESGDEQGPGSTSMGTASGAREEATMATDHDGDQVVEEQASATSMVLLHPMVVMSVSEHYTRIRMNSGNPQEPCTVIGAIYGTQSHRTLELRTAVAWAFKGDGTFDEFLHTQLDEAVRRNFEHYELLGWYATGTEPTQWHLDMHKKVCQLTDSPLLVLLDAEREEASETLPVHVYETHLDVRNDEQAVRFLKAQFKIVTDEAERIGVDHIAKTGLLATSNRSQVEAQLTSQYNAIRMLAERVAAVRDFLTDVKQGRVTAPRRLLREIASLCSQLPIGAQTDLNATLNKERVDAMLASGLTEVTKALNTVAQMAQNAQVVKSKTKSATTQRLF